MGGMIKQPSPSPRAGALSQFMIASVECCLCARHCGMGAGAVHRVGSKGLQRLVAWLQGRGPHLEEEHALRQEPGSYSIQTLVCLRRWPWVAHRKDLIPTGI